MPLICGIPPTLGADDAPYGLNTLLAQGIHVLPLGTDYQFIQSGVRRMRSYIDQRATQS